MSNIRQRLAALERQAAIHNTAVIPMDRDDILHAYGMMGFEILTSLEMIDHLAVPETEGTEQHAWLLATRTALRDPGYPKDKVRLSRDVRALAIDVLISEGEMSETNRFDFPRIVRMADSGFDERFAEVMQAHKRKGLKSC